MPRTIHVQVYSYIYAYTYVKIRTRVTGLIIETGRSKRHTRLRPAGGWSEASSLGLTSKAVDLTANASACAMRTTTIVVVNPLRVHYTVAVYHCHFHSFTLTAARQIGISINHHPPLTYTFFPPIRARRPSIISRVNPSSLAWKVVIVPRSGPYRRRRVQRAPTTTNKAQS